MTTLWPIRLSAPLRTLYLGVAYFGLAAATIGTTRWGGGVAILWVATALLVAELTVTPVSRWPGRLAVCGLASCIATSLFGFGAWAALPLAAVNIAEAFIAAHIMGRYRLARTALESLEGMAIFVFAVGVAAPALTAFGGAGTSALAGQSFWANWMRWYAGHALGGLAFTPIMLLVLRGDIARWIGAASRAMKTEIVAIVLMVIMTSVAVFGQSSKPLLFLPALPITIATFRAGRFGAAVSVIILAVVGGWFTLAGRGPVALMAGTEEAHLQFFQFYLAVTVLTALPVAADLARRKQLFQQLRDSEARYRLLTNRSSDIVMNLDVDGCIRFVSPSIATLGGYDPATAVGRNALDYVHPDYRDAVTATHRQALARPDETHIVEYRGCTADHRAIWLETHTQAVLDESGQAAGVVTTIREISHRKRREAELARDAETDALTGIPNRRGFIRTLEERIATEPSPSTGCVALFDLDFFKRINDQHGHATGDRVLQAFARTAVATVRGHDVVGRLGGEEFAVLLVGASPDQALLVCDRLRERIEALELDDKLGRPVGVTVSAGVAPLAAGMDSETILAAADEALYRAKAAGRNCLKLAA